jgi:hypothetical protein
MGLLAIVSGLLLVVAGVICLCLVKTRRGMAIYLALALLPAALGAVGTAFGYAAVQEAARSSGMTREALADGIRVGEAQARCAGYVGLASSLLPLVLGLVGLATRVSPPPLPRPVSGNSAPER